LVEWSCRWLEWRKDAPVVNAPFWRLRRNQCVPREVDGVEDRRRLERGEYCPVKLAALRRQRNGPAWQPCQSPCHLHVQSGSERGDVLTRKIRCESSNECVASGHPTKLDGCCNCLDERFDKVAEAVRWQAALRLRITCWQPCQRLRNRRPPDGAGDRLVLILNARHITLPCRLALDFLQIGHTVPAFWPTTVWAITFCTPATPPPRARPHNPMLATVDAL